MKSILRIALWTLAGFFAVCAQAQTGTYTQKVDVEGRSGYLNFFGVELFDNSGTLRGNYSLECNRNTINSTTCQFALTLDSVSYRGKVTFVDIYFPFNDADSDDHGPFKYEWSATSSNNVTLTGSSQGNGHWVYNHGYQPVIESGTTITVN